MSGANNKLEFAYPVIKFKLQSLAALFLMFPTPLSFKNINI